MTQIADAGGASAVPRLESEKAAAPESTAAAPAAAAAAAAAETQEPSAADTVFAPSPPPGSSSSPGRPRPAGQKAPAPRVVASSAADAAGETTGGLREPDSSVAFLRVESLLEEYLTRRAQYSPDDSASVARDAAQFIFAQVLGEEGAAMQAPATTAGATSRPATATSSGARAAAAAAWAESLVARFPAIAGGELLLSGDEAQHFQRSVARRLDRQDAMMQALVEKEVRVRLPAVELAVLRAIRQRGDIAVSTVAGAGSDGSRANLLAGSGLAEEAPMSPRSPSRPMTAASRPLTGEAAQAKAAWVSGSYQAIALVDNQLSPKELESTLVERVIAREPDRQVVGVTEAIVRDMATSVVREIVGIFESLLDRILTEKKQDTIRAMVAELMTSDLASTVATAHDRLRLRELGHLERELERLRLEVRQRDATWEDRFRITRELRDSQDDLWATIDERCSRIEATVSDAAAAAMQRVELEAALKRTAADLEDVRQRASAAVAKTEETGQNLEALRATCVERYATQEALQKAAFQAWEATAAERARTEEQLEELRRFAAPQSEHLNLKAKHEEHSAALSARLDEADRRMEALEGSLTSAQDAAKQTFAAKADVESDVKRLTDHLDELKQSIAAGLADLDRTRATKAALEEHGREAKDRFGALEASLAKTSGDLARTSDDLGALRREALDFATQKFATETANQVAQKVCLECDEKEEIAQLRREFEEERERLRLSVRQQQHNRTDLNEAIQELGELSKKTDVFGQSVEVLNTRVERIDSRETDDMQKIIDAADKQRQHLDSLKSSIQGLKDEFNSHVQKQRKDDEKLVNHSTQRYLEQIDKALNLQNKIEKVEGENLRLHEHVRAIRLP